MKNKELHSEFTFQIEPKHYFKHNYLTYCNDVLVSMLKYADEEKMASVSIDLGNGENIEFEQDEKWQEWLITHGHREEMYEVYYRHTFFSLVADFCSYMLESINCAAKMKVAVSYALLRKPLKDTLGYIEWLRVDRNGMLDLLASGKPEDLVITKEKALEHTSLIEGNCKMSSFFDFRYNKASETSLEHIWNNANHLITTKYKLSKTEPGNLNFVFADEAILRSFSDYYYITVPAIMSYAVNLICEMFEEFAPLNKYTVLMNKLNRTLRSFEMLETISFDDAKKLYSSGNVPIVCPRCGLKMKMTDISWEKFCELSEANRRMFISDYQILFEAAINDGLKIQNRELYQVDRLISLGLLQNQNRLGGNVWLDFVDDPEKQNDIIVTSFGKTFYHNSPAALKRN